MSWPETKFENLYEIPSKNGLTRPAKVRGSGYKMINMGELFAHDRIGSIDMELVPMNEKELSQMLVHKDDLLFARQSLVLAGAGKCSIVRDVDQPTTFESHIIRVRLNKAFSNPKFYYYYFKSPTCRLKSIVTQGVQAGIRGNDLKKLSVHTPPLDVQDKVSELLERYDNLIENNNRRIELLEESARQLYKEWFVRLRFPGHEHVKIVDGVPDGWCLETYGDAFEFLSGFAFKSKTYTDGGKYGVVTIKNVHDSRFVPECPSRVEQLPGKMKDHCKLTTGDILLSLTGNVGRACILFGGSYLLNQRVAKIVTKGNVTPEFAYWTFTDRGNQRKIENLAYGVAQLNLSPVKLAAMDFVIPRNTLIKQFSEITSSVFKQIIQLNFTNQELANARDLILPKLMNGEIAA